MKGFFLLLLLTNLAIVGWQLMAEDEPHPIDPYSGVKLSSEGLILLSEMGEEERPPARKLLAERESENEAKSRSTGATVQGRALVDSPRVEGDTTRCYQSSLLTDLNEAKTLQATLKKSGVEKSERKTIEATVVNYWVKLNPYRSRAKANEAAEILKKNRIKDFFIVRSGRHENAISLGVFSTHERAEKRFQQITALRARLRKPVIEAMELPAKRLIVEFSVESGETVELAKGLFDTTKPSHLKKISCKH